MAAWSFVLLVALALLTPVQASHKPPYLVRDSDGDLWLDPVEALLGTNRYDADSDPADLDGNCVATTAGAADPDDPANLTRDADGDGSPDANACPVPETPVGPDDLPVNGTDDPPINATDALPINGTDDLPLPNGTEAPEPPAAPGAPDPNIGSPCLPELMPACDDDDDGDYPSGGNDGARDDYHEREDPPQDDGSSSANGTGSGTNDVDETLEDANGTTEPAQEAAEPAVKEVRAQMNETTGLVDVTWVVDEEDEESDADRYAIYRSDNSEPIDETQHRQNQPNQTIQDRTHPEGNVTYMVVPLYDTANGTVAGNGTESDPEEFEPFPEEVGEELRKCGPLDLDTDLDAICDAAETILGTNPLLVDSDGDGIPDPLALRLGLVGPNGAGDDDARDDPEKGRASAAGTSGAEPADMPTIVHGVLGFGATLMAGAVGAIVRFRRP